MAESFRESLQKIIDEDPTIDVVDEFLGGFESLMTQPVRSPLKSPTSGAGNPHGPEAFPNAPTSVGNRLHLAQLPLTLRVRGNHHGSERIDIGL